MSMLEAHRNEVLRQRFGILADRICKDLDEPHEGGAPRRKSEAAPERRTRRDDGAFLLTYLWLSGWGIPHLSLH